MLVPVRRVRSPAAAGLGFDLGEPRGRAVDLEHLVAGVLDDELGRRAGRDRAAVGHDQHRVGKPLGLLDVVGGHQDRRALGAKRVDQRPELLPDLGVEPDRRLVEEHEPRPMHERAGDQQPPAHPAGELVDPRVPPVDEVRHLQRALDRLAPVGAADPVEVREDEQVLLDGQRHVEVVELRHDAALGAGGLRLARAGESRAPRARPRPRSTAPSAAASSSTCPRRSGPSRPTHVPMGTSRSRWSTAVICP